MAASTKSETLYPNKAKAKKGRRLKLPYANRSDAAKIRSQWTKLTGLHQRNEPSAAIVRAATAPELSINLAIRAEFAARSELPSETINAMLKKANGLWGKMAGLLIPLVIDRPNEAAFKRLCKASEQINKDRNEIVHSGEFRSRSEAIAAIERCRKFINSLVQLYEPKFKLASLSPDSLEEEAVPEPQPQPKITVKPRFGVKKTARPKG